MALNSVNGGQRSGSLGPIPAWIGDYAYVDAIDINDDPTRHIHVIDVPSAAST